MISDRNSDARKALCWVTFAFLVAANQALGAPAFMPDSAVTRSLSGQFIIHDQRSGGPSEMAGHLTTNGQFTSFEPNVLAVSSERLKNDLWRELGLRDASRDKVHLILHPARTADDPITVTRERFRDGWQYRLDLPDTVDRTRYVRTMVQVVLLEMANRGGASRSADIPRWLVEGLSQQLLASDATEIIVPPPRRNLNGLVLTATNYNARLEDPLKQARLNLRGQPIITFEDLSWARDEQWTTNHLYPSSAQLLVHELLALEKGNERLRGMVSMLASHYNWQVAFLKAFASDFPRLLEVEKWWALRVLHFTATGPMHTLAADESLHKLEELLRQSVEVRGSTNQLPLHTEMTLQEVVAGWDNKSQTEALQLKIRQLDAVRSRLSPTIGSIAEGYRQILANYLKEAPSQSNLSPRRKALQKRAQTTTVDRLNALDSRLQSLRSPPDPVADTRQVPSP